MTKKKSPVGKKKKNPWPQKDLDIFENRLLAAREKVIEELIRFGENFSNTQRDSAGDLSS